MTSPAVDLAGALPPDTGLRVGTVLALTGSSATVSVNGKTIQCGFLDPNGLAVGAPVAIMRGAASWLALGVVNASSQARSGLTLGANTCTAGTVVTTGAAEAAVPSASWLTEPIYQFNNGRIFKLSITGGCFEAAGLVTQCNIRVRKGQATVVGTVLTLLRYNVPPGIAASVPTFDHVGWFKNSSGATVTSALSLTLQRQVGAANVSLFGDAATPIPLMIVVEDYCGVGDNAALSAICATV